MVSSTGRVVATAVICMIFCISYVFFIQPTVLYFFGFKYGRDETVHEVDKSVFRHENSYTPRYPVPSKAREKKSGLMAAVLPFYALGIVAYFAYTIFKLMNNRSDVSSHSKDPYLKDYYRKFRNVTEKGKFQMDSDSSDDVRGSELRNSRPGYNIGWFSAPDNLAPTPNVYRSFSGLSKDLESLLKKADDENLDDAELTRLRDRLGQMENQMTQLLEAVNASTSYFSHNGCHLNLNRAKLSCKLQEPCDNEALYSAGEDNSS